MRSEVVQRKECRRKIERFDEDEPQGKIILICATILFVLALVTSNFPREYAHWKGAEHHFRSGEEQKECTAE
jgi:hypothetical protein